MVSKASRSTSSRSTSSASRTRSTSRQSRTSQSRQTRQASQARQGDRASVGREARGPQASNPVNFGAWSGGLLKNGSKGGDVATMQKALNEKTGGNIKVDGKFGKETRAALEKFQKDQNLKVDGLAGDQTREALMGQAAPRQPQTPQPQGNQAQPASGPAPVEGPSKAAPTQATQATQPGERSAFGSRLAKDAERIAASGVAGRGRNCKRGVRMALEKQGMTLNGVSAYMAADQLAKNKKFGEAKGLQRNDLRNLPPGAIVVWNKGKGHPHGHISVALGNGREASDVLRNQIVNYPSSFRVFMPQ